MFLLPGCCQKVPEAMELLHTNQLMPMKVLTLHAALTVREVLVL